MHYRHSGSRGAPNTYLSTPVITVPMVQPMAQLSGSPTLARPAFPAPNGRSPMSQSTDLSLHPHAGMPLSQSFWMPLGCPSKISPARNPPSVEGLIVPQGGIRPFTFEGSLLDMSG